MSTLAEYPCSDDSKCAQCPTLLSHYNMGVLCNLCRRKVTEEMNGTDTYADAWPFRELLKRKRRRNRRFVQSPAIHSGLLVQAAPLVRAARRHYPQEGHR